MARNAVAEAREQMERLRRKGDAEGADTLLRIIVAIGELGTPPTEQAMAVRQEGAALR